jgi:glycosyltransferase involved in cell wall biosynthesis
MRVVIVHDWLTVFAGAERVLEQILRVFPEADLFSLVDFLPQNQRHLILNKKVHTSFIQNLPFAKKKYRHYLPLMPLAIEQFDLNHYDIVISSSHAVAKGIITHPEQLHICYCHSPMRYAWDMNHQYLREANLNKSIKGWAVKWLLHRLRQWDQHAANRVDYFVANSKFIESRIHKTYRREAKIIYPPVDIENFILSDKKDNFYLTA